MSSLSVKNLLLLGIITVLFAAIPLTLYLIHRQQQTQSGAQAATTLSFSPASDSVPVGGQKSFDIMVNPGGVNQVSYVKMKITFDGTKVKAVSFTPTAALPSVFEGPDLTQANASTITLSAGADPTKIISGSQAVKIATITFQGLAVTSAPIQIAFDTTNNAAGQPNTQVLSSGSDASSSENVLSTTTPATLAVGGGSATTTPPPTTSGGGGGGTGNAGTAPVCTSLGIDRATTGNAPYSLTFTATGNSTTSTISKVTFNFGDGPVINVTQGSGIGTSSVSVPTAHTYQNAGTYTASAILTDANGNTSSPATCTQTITVSTAVAAGGAGGGVPVVTLPPPTSAPVAVAPTTRPPVSGPGNVILGVGAVGGALSVIGGLLFLLL